MTPILLIVVPLILAFLAIISKSVGRYLMIIGLAFNVITVFFLEKGSYIIGGFKPPYGINLMVDDYALYGVIVLNVLFALIISINLYKVKNIQPIILVALGALNGMILTGDLFNLFVFLEIGSIAAYIIIATNKKHVAVFNYLIMATVGSSLYLFGVVILYAQYGTLNMSALSDRLMEQGLISAIPIILIFVGIGVEAKLMPLNGWVKGVLKDSDTLVGPMIASVYAGVILLVFGRLFGDVLILNDWLVLGFSILAVITVIMGEIAAFSSFKLREILLYSSIAQSGLVVLLFVNGLIGPAMLVLFANVLVKFILFTLSTHISISGTDDLNELGGIFRSNPLNGLAFSIAALSLMGLPIFFGFAVKMNVLLALFKADLWWIPIVILFASLIEGGYIVRMLVGLWNPGKEGEYAKDELATDVVYPIKSYVCIMILAISLTIVALGIMPSQIIDPVTKAGNELTNSITTEQITEKGGIN